MGHQGRGAWRAGPGRSSTGGQGRSAAEQPRCADVRHRQLPRGPIGQTSSTPHAALVRIQTAGPTSFPMGGTNSWRAEVRKPARSRWLDRMFRATSLMPAPAQIRVWGLGVRVWEGREALVAGQGVSGDVLDAHACIGAHAKDHQAPSISHHPSAIIHQPSAVTRASQGLLMMWRGRWATR